MSAAAAFLAGVPPARRRPRLPSAPVAALAAVAALAWVGMAAGIGSMPQMAGAAPPQQAGSPPWICGLSPGSMPMVASGGGGGALGDALAAMPMWSLMVIAMMLPAALPASAHVGANSLRRRRGRATAEFALAYLAPWLALGVPVLLLSVLLRPLAGAVVLAAALGVAAAWEVSPAKRWSLNRCHRTSPLPPRGWRATVGSARFGILHGGACIASCWPLMVAMALAPFLRLAWCAAFALAVFAEKGAFRPRRATRRIGAALLAAGATSLVVGLFGI